MGVDGCVGGEDGLSRVEFLGEGSLRGTHSAKTINTYKILLYYSGVKVLLVVAGCVHNDKSHAIGLNTGHDPGQNATYRQQFSAAVFV